MYGQIAMPEQYGAAYMLMLSGVFFEGFAPAGMIWHEGGYYGAGMGSTGPSGRLFTGR